VVSRPSKGDKGYHFDDEVDDAVSSIFGERVVSITRAVAWPGSRLFGHSAKVYEIALDEAVCKRMVATENMVSGWTHRPRPPLPEDICLFRRGDVLPVFVSVTHECDAWLLSEKGAEFDGATLSSIPPDLMIPRRVGFCEPEQAGTAREVEKPRSRRK
jgi:hypothetical protein